ncbi:phosphodiester glycosidase family protein [Paenibacillus alvei]|uniref:phosphodiester glycosidase family protein n=1 Tax=Paenibacillus alvei TaxID=44250 RepID=UPI00227EFFB5|nr:phosphodiester glycosidase family protein [Paenibacillus alvei]MCY7483636.1 phosphodiester glycosidase family protein [Paenibacillus alvei]
MPKLKKIITAVLGLALTFTVIIPQGQANADASSYGLMDTKAYRTYVPIRYLSDKLHYQVTWEPVSKRIEVVSDDNYLEMTLGTTQAYVNGVDTELDAAPFRSGGTTYVPVRIVSEAMSLNMEWDKNGSVVHFWSGDSHVRLPVVSKQRSSQASSIEKSKRAFKVGSKRVYASMLTINLLHPRIRLGVGVGYGGEGSVDNLKHMAQRNYAVAAINGGYFDAYSKTKVRVPYGYVVRNGRMIHNGSGDKRSVLVFTKGNQVEMIPGESFLERFNEGDVQGALQVGPRLLTDGKITVNLKGEGFKDPKILKHSSIRSAVGLTKDYKLIILTTSSATIPELARVMKQAGAYQAMNLDGGASSGLYYNGRYMTYPGRSISNALLIFK